jgi:multiple sugar transport system permease protein
VAKPLMPQHSMAFVGSFRRGRRSGGLFTFLMVAPVTIYALAVSVYPLLYAIVISFFHYNLVDPGQVRTFVGLGNYTQALDDPQAVTSVVNTFVLVVGAVGLEFVVGLGLALLLWRDTTLNKFAAALLLIPISITPLVSGLIWRAMLSPDFGSIGWYLAKFLGVQQGLTAQTSTAMFAIILVDAWQWSPLMMLILLTGLRSLPLDIFDAAQVDGAGRWQTFSAVVLPLLRPTIVIALLIRTMDAFKIFDIIYAMTQGGPGLSTTVLNYYTFQQGLVFFKMGYAAALSNVLLVMIGIVSVFYIVRVGREPNQNHTRPEVTSA